MKRNCIRTHTLKKREAPMMHISDNRNNTNKIETQYLDLLRTILEEGTDCLDRTGVGTKAIFGAMLKHDMRDGFPLYTTKRLPFSAIVAENLWFLKGSTNINELRALTHGEEYRFSKESNKKTIWDANYNHQGKELLGYEDGFCGPIYGYQWRNFDGSGLDQIKAIIEEATNKPDSRRLVVSAWNPLQLNEMILPPCHYSFQFNIEKEFIDISFNMRSNDVFLGNPWNISGYALQLMIIARILGKTPRFVVCNIANAHIYNNHIDQVKEQLQRIPYGTLPTVVIDSKLKTLEDFEKIATPKDFVLVNYNHYPAIKAPMAV